MYYTISMDKEKICGIERNGSPLITIAERLLKACELQRQACQEALKIISDMEKDNEEYKKTITTNARIHENSGEIEEELR